MVGGEWREEGGSAWILGDEDFRLGIVVSGATIMKAGFAAKHQKTFRLSPGLSSPGFRLTRPWQREQATRLWCLLDSSTFIRRTEVKNPH